MERAAYGQSDDTAGDSSRQVDLGIVGCSNLGTVNTKGVTENLRINEITQGYRSILLITFSPHYGELSPAPHIY